jgi:IS30 family transposase
MRDRRRTPAGGVQAEKRQRYVQLIAQGVSNSEAYRLVGINRKTGNRWRYGRRVRNSAGALVIYALAEAVQRLLAKRWSPEQVAHELRVLFADQPSRWLCKETIYQAIYDTAVAVTRPARRQRRRRRLHGLQRRGRLTAMRMIDERPAEVDDRVQAGHGRAI